MLLQLQLLETSRFDQSLMEERFEIAIRHDVGRINIRLILFVTVRIQVGTRRG